MKTETTVTNCGRLRSSNSAAADFRLGRFIAGQPTMSRFEYVPSRTALYRIAQAFVDVFCDSYKKGLR